MTPSVYTLRPSDASSLALRCVRLPSMAAFQFATARIRHARNCPASKPTCTLALAAYARARRVRSDRPADQRAEPERARTRCKLLSDRLAPRRRVVHAGDVVYSRRRALRRRSTSSTPASSRWSTSPPTAASRSSASSSAATGSASTASPAARYSCDAVAMDTGEVWVDPLRRAARRRAVACPALLHRPARGDEPRDRPRPRLADVGLHAAGRRARRRVPALAGPTRSPAAACAPTRSRCA